MSFPFPGKSKLGSIRFAAPVVAKLPNGAKSVREHKLAITEDDFWLDLSKIKLEKIPQEVTGYDFLRMHSGQRFCDATILDKLVEAATSGLKGLSYAQRNLSVLGEDCIIMFFGTTFVAANGKEAVSFLNLSTCRPALRYLTYMAGPMKFLPVPSYAAIMP